MNSGIFFPLLSVFSYTFVSENMTLGGSWEWDLIQLRQILVNHLVLPWHRFQVHELNFPSFLVIYPEGVVAGYPEKTSHRGEDPKSTKKAMVSSWMEAALTW